MINAKTRLCCIIGNPVGHSLSPQMHNAAYKKLELNFVFVAFRVEEVKRALEGFRVLGVCGIVVTVPHKQEVMKYVDEIDETAQTIGAVNTIVNDGGILKTTNTDWIGAMEALEEVTAVSGKHAVIIGAGGAARALVYGLKSRGAKVVVVNRTPQNAEKLYKEFKLDGFGSLDDRDKIRKADIVINATTVGMEEDISPIPADFIDSHHTVFDIVYTPRETRLLRLARERGAKIVYGYKMVLYGGVRQFELFTGKKAPVEVMEKALNSYVT